MNKKMIMWILIGWLASLAYSPKHLLGMFGGGGAKG